MATLAAYADRMARMEAVRQNLVDALAEEVLHGYGRGRVIVAVDSADVEAADAFAGDLVERLKKRGHSAFSARADDFFAPLHRRRALGTDSAEGRYQNTYDYRTLRRVLIDPFEMGGSAAFVAAHYDRKREQPIEPKWLTAPDDAVLVVSGEYLQRPELQGAWNFVVWLESTPPGQLDALAVAARKLYAKDVKARDAADTIIDITDPDAPVQVAQPGVE